MVAQEKFTERGQAQHWPRPQRIRQGVQRCQSVRRAELLDERVRVTQPFGGIMRQLWLRPHVHLCQPVACLHARWLPNSCFLRRRFASDKVADKRFNALQSPQVIPIVLWPLLRAPSARGTVCARRNDKYDQCASRNERANARPRCVECYVLSKVKRL